MQTRSEGYGKMAGNKIIKQRCKQAAEENFPVEKLVSKKLRPLVSAYYNAARQADDIADNSNLSREEKLEKLLEIERAFYGKNEDNFPVASALGKLFAAENLDASLFADLLKAFRRDAENKQPEIWEQLTDYCNYSAVPVGRFMLAVCNENPSTYLPAAVLCSVLQIANHLQDLKYDIVTAERVYLPLQMMNEFQVRNSDLYLTKEIPAFTALKKEILNRLRGMTKDTDRLPYLIRNRRLRIEIGIILSLTNSMLEKLEKCDILSCQVKLSKLDWVKAWVFGLKFIF